MPDLPPKRKKTVIIPATWVHCDRCEKLATRYVVLQDGLQTTLALCTECYKTFLEKEHNK